MKRVIATDVDRLQALIRTINLLVDEINSLRNDMNSLRNDINRGYPGYD